MRNPGLAAGPAENRVPGGGWISAAGMLDQRPKGVVEVRADRRTDLLGRWTRRLEAVYDAHAMVVRRLDAVRRPHDGPRHVRLIDDLLSVDAVRHAQLARILAVRSRRELP